MFASWNNGYSYEQGKTVIQVHVARFERTVVAYSVERRDARNREICLHRTFLLEVDLA